MSFIFNTLGADKAGEDKRRRFKTPQSARHLENETDAESINALSSVLEKSYPAVQRYYRVKARLLKIKDFAIFDRYAPFEKNQRKVSFSEGQKLVVEAFSEFSPQLGVMTKEFFTRRWVDAAKRPGKRGGAFCSYVTPDLHPYIFINYEGALRDIFTLAHEMGHALHGCLMRKQSLLNYDSPLTIAEAASTFGEMLLFKQLKERAKSKAEKTSLLVHKIDNIIATVHRQISMYLFESDFHSTYIKSGELPAAAINSLWQNRQKQLYGNSVRLVPGSEVLWSYIPHFLHTPFYVYAYSFGELLALVFYSLYLKNPRRFAESYVNFLSLGSTERPEHALKRFGIDLKSAALWQQGVDILNGMVAELEEASA